MHSFEKNKQIQTGTKKEGALKRGWGGGGGNTSLSTLAYVHRCFHLVVLKLRVPSIDERENSPVLHCRLTTSV